MHTQKHNIFYYSSDGKLVQEKTEQHWLLCFLYQNFIGKLIRRLFTKRFISRFYGFLQNSSLSKYKIDSFVKKHSIQMDQFEKKISEFKSFNDFFIRKLKTGIRSITQDQNIFVSPADGKLFVIEKISQEVSFFVKNEKFNLESFLVDKTLAKEYQDGTLLIFRLSPPDYHRFHFPTDCIPSSPKRISGIYESVSPIAYKHGIIPLIQNERCLTILKTEFFSDVISVSIGAMLVGKIINTFVPEKKYKKGDEMGYFEFGGSSLVLVFKKDSIVLQKKFIENSKRGFETEVKMGQSIN
jgi:phosphatidylserine decarboxylase